MYALDHAEEYKLMRIYKDIETKKIETQIQLCLTRNMLDEVTGKSSYKQNVPNVVVFSRENVAVQIAVLRTYEVVQVEKRMTLAWQQVVCKATNCLLSNK